MKAVILAGGMGSRISVAEAGRACGIMGREQRLAAEIDGCCTLARIAKSA